MHHEGDTTTTVSLALLLVDSYSKSCIMAYAAGVGWNESVGWDWT